ASCAFSVALGTCQLGPIGNFGFNFSGSDTRTGGFLGAGIEYAFLPNWSAKVEYDFFDFGTKDQTFTSPLLLSPFTATASTSIREVVHTVKVGVNYRFDWGSGNWGTWGH